ncbi:uncharacterized protein RBU47_009278 isoform 1-T1 [Passerculus sandwichensis]
MTRLCRGAGAIATLAAARPGRAGASRDGGTEGGRKEPRGPCPGPAVGRPEAAAAGLSVSRDGDGPSPARGNGSLQLNAQVKRAESVPSMNKVTCRSPGQSNTGAAGRGGFVLEDPGARGGYVSLQLQAATGPKGCTHPERTGTLRNVGCRG